MATIKHIFKGESLSMLFAFPAEYDMARIQSHGIWIGGTEFTGVIIGQGIELKLTSIQTDLMSGNQRVSLWIDDTILGVRKPYVGDIAVGNTNATPDNESTSEVYDVIVNVDISVTSIEAGDLMFNYIKGDPFTYDDFTPEQKAELQQPANDAAILAYEKAGLANDAAILANEKAGLANDAAILANEKAGLADSKATLANDAAALATEVATHPDTIVADYWHKWNTVTNAYETTGIKAKGEPGAVAEVEQTVTKSTINVPCSNAVYGELSLKPTVHKVLVNLLTEIETTVICSSFSPELKYRPLSISVYHLGILKDVSAKYIVSENGYNIILTSPTDLYGAEVVVFTDNRSLLDDIESWQATDDPVHIGGRPSSLWVNSSASGSNATCMMPKFSCRQKSKLTHVRVRVFQFNGTTAWKLKLFRYNYNTSVYDLISETQFHPTGVGDQYCTLDTPLECEMSDTPAIYVPASNMVRIHDSNVIVGGLRSASGDITTSNSFATVNNFPMHFEVFGYRPYLAITGASTQMGANGGANNNWYGSQFNGTLGTNSVTVPGGNPLSEIWSRLKSRIPSLRYQNHALSTNTFAWGLTTGVPAALAVHPKILIIGFGLNDIAQGVTWEQAEANLNAIKLLVDASTVEKLYLMEMQPRTAETDAYNATLRQWNANFQSWANNNGARVIRLHDIVGQIRTSSGYIDDIKPEYNQDGVHLTLSGVDKFAELVLPYLM